MFLDLRFCFQSYLQTHSQFEKSSKCQDQKQHKHLCHNINSKPFFQKKEQIPRNIPFVFLNDTSFPKHDAQHGIFWGDEITKPSQKSEISRPRHHPPAMRWLETRWEIAPGGGAICVS